MALDLIDDGYLTVTVRPAEGGQPVTVEGLDLFAVYCRVQDVLRKHLKQDGEGEAGVASDVQEIMQSLGLPTVAKATAIKFAEGVCAEYARQKKTSGGGSTPGSPGSTGSTPGS